MKFTIISIFLLFIIATSYLFYLAHLSKNQTTLSLVNDQLKSCPKTPNCISSQHPNDTQHYITPIQLKDSVLINYTKVAKSIITKMNGEISKESSNYIAAIFTSDIFGFIDDFEILIDEEKNVMHLRSASRVGRSDLGINRKRVDLFKLEFSKLISSPNQL